MSTTDNRRPHELKQELERALMWVKAWEKTSAQLEAENLRLRSALERIAAYEYRGGHRSPYHYQDEMSKPSAAKIARQALDGTT